ncbi:hypothetical protein DXH78_07465 [Undibacter mobilis]|uniref:Uncharacterized protein n=2 Tax=Undibacter mobilis TaxID=2292256 RepID=A0A371BA11_9BRAD|nr:hypothetical protein DXH78_07465 [Undibacter mobilis]
MENVMTLSVHWSQTPRGAAADSPARRLAWQCVKGAGVAILLASMLVAIIGVRIYAFVPALH